jgi:hypothetical protein
VPEDVVPPLQGLLDTIGMGLAASEANGRFTGDAEEVDKVYALAEDLLLTAIERYARE